MLSFRKRLYVFVRDNFTCHYCGKKADEFIIFRGKRGNLIQVIDHNDWRGFEIDHKVPVSKGGDNSFDNLLTSCAKCNNSKSAKDYIEFVKIK